jgi:hypothetical protein
MGTISSIVSLVNETLNKSQLWGLRWWMVFSKLRIPNMIGMMNLVGSKLHFTQLRIGK